jgi:hypothetical protein
MARLEEGLHVLQVLASDDVLEIQTRDGRHEEAASAVRVPEAPQAVVTGAVLLVRVVVADDGGQIACLERGGHRFGLGTGR